VTAGTDETGEASGEILGEAIVAASEEHLLEWADLPQVSAAAVLADLLGDLAGAVLEGLLADLVEVDSVVLRADLAAVVLVDLQAVSGEATVKAGSAR
jgi:hypothetical protein